MFDLAEFLEPYKPRPETTAAVARNLVANALGLKNRVSREKQKEDRQKLKDAKGLFATVNVILYFQLVG